MRDGLSLTPNFSRVLTGVKGQNRFNGLLTPGKPLKRLAIIDGRPRPAEAGLPMGTNKRVTP